MIYKKKRKLTKQSELINKICTFERLNDNEICEKGDGTLLPLSMISIKSSSDGNNTAQERSLINKTMTMDEKSTWNQCRK